MRYRLKIIGATIFLCALILGGFLLHDSARPASAAPAFRTVDETIISFAWQTAGTETEQQSMLPALLVAISALTLTFLRIFFRRRTKDQDT